MKKTIIFLAVFCICSGSVLYAQDVAPAIPVPVVTVSLRSFKDLSTAVEQVVNTAVPGMGLAAAGQIPGSLGIPELKGVDQEKPVHIVIGFIGEEVPPVIALCVPVTDLEAFKKGMMPGSPLKETPHGDNYISAMNEYAVIVLNIEKNGVSSIQKIYRETAAEWPLALEKPGTLIEARFSIPPVRSMLLANLRKGKASVLENMPAAAIQPGVDPKVFGEMMNAYFSFFETLIRETESAEVNLDLTDKAITAETVITPGEKSDLKKKLSAPEFSLGDIALWLDKKAPIAFIGGMGPKNPFEGMLENLMGLSFKAQGYDAASAEKLKKQSMAFMELMTPSLFAVSANISMNGFSSQAVYKVDEGDAEKLLNNMKDMIEVMKTQAGSNKMFTKFEYTPDSRKSNGIRVDRFEMAFNLLDPKIAPQAMVLQMMKLDRMVYEYAAAGSLFMYGTPDGFDDFIDSVRNRPAGGVLHKNMTFKGHINLVGIAKEYAGMLAMMLPAVSQVLMNTEASGHEIEVETFSAGNARVLMRLPLKLIETGGKIALAVMQKNNAPAGGQAPAPVPVPEPEF